jgi:hypothetical protein
LGESEPPEGGKATARGGWVQEYLGEDWVEIEPGIYQHRPGEPAQTIHEALEQRVADAADDGARSPEDFSRRC